MSETPHQTGETRNRIERFLWISRKEWEDEPGACAVKLGTLAAAVLAAGQLAPFIAIAAGLVIVGKAVRS